MRRHDILPERSALAPLALLAGLAGCEGAPTEPRPEPGPPAWVIVDGARAGEAGFYFLPPMVPAPTYSGSFDGSRSPEVWICELASTGCGGTVASFSGAQVKVDVAEEAYQATWKTGGAGLDPSKRYRLQVAVDGTVLGHADLVVLDKGSEGKAVDREQYVAVRNGGTLPIRFRIETPPPPTAPPGSGDLITFPQTDWGTPGSVQPLLAAHFGTVYASTWGVLEVGLSGTAGFSMLFTGPDAVSAYLPASGAPAPLTADLSDPVSPASGALGGEVLALALNIDFSDAAVGGVILSADALSARYVNLRASPTRFGDLTLCDLSILPQLNGQTVRQVLGTLNAVLGGESGSWDVRELQLFAADLNAAFADGLVSTFAVRHLAGPTCQPIAWRDGELVTLTQERWGGDVAAALLDRHYPTLYAPTFGVVEVGLPGPAGFSAQFSASHFLFAYLPVSGAPAPLDADLSDPQTTASGIFGGEVLALRLNIDFSDAGHVVGTSGVRFGDRRLCNVSGGPSGVTVREFLGVVNTALGGGATPYAVADLSELTQELNVSYTNGLPTQFARDHLVSGACP